MDHQSCRLLNDGQILVLIIDLERNLLWCKRNRFEGIQVDFDCFSASNTVSGLVLPPLDTDGARAIQHLNLRSGQMFETRGKKDVETSSAIVRICQELHF